MSNDTITYVIAGTAAGVSVIAWAALILAAFALAGSALGAAILWYYDEI
jgi:hypothetical protein